MGHILIVLGDEVGWEMGFEVWHHVVQFDVTSVVLGWVDLSVFVSLLDSINQLQSYRCSINSGLNVFVRTDNYCSVTVLWALWRGIYQITSFLSFQLLIPRGHNSSSSASSCACSWRNQTKRTPRWWKDSKVANKAVGFLCLVATPDVLSSINTAPSCWHSRVDYARVFFQLILLLSASLTSRCDTNVVYLVWHHQVKHGLIMLPLIKLLDWPRNFWFSLLFKCSSILGKAVG